MTDEIETAADLVDVAELRHFVIHDLVARRETTPDPHALGLPPEELHAPGSTDDDAAVSFFVRLEDEKLGVRCRVETRNAYCSFLADGEAVFFLPAPLPASKRPLIAEFIEQAGAVTVFPYVRAAIASLAAQMAVPASPLPLLRAGELRVALDDAPVVEQEPSPALAHGTLAVTNDSGDPEQIGEFFIDESTGLVTRIGAEGQVPEFDEFLDAIADMPSPEDMTWEDVVRRHGESSIRQSVEDLREANGDAATDAMLTEIDEAAATIAMTDAFSALNEAVDDLNGKISAAQSILGNHGTTGSDDKSNAEAALIAAAEQVRDGWKRVMDTTLLPDH
ncbi:hypothetical protein [Mycobacterium sp. ST-F2]|uniref:hypothetical protein n=1 Tax=Mycobacterium sp. ST-F2 TaxID=1490484 RepID=UPI0009393ED1|nr:hypothetical protein [Mycobacterium sp. ST-F2]